VTIGDRSRTPEGQVLAEEAVARLVAGRGGWGWAWAGMRAVWTRGSASFGSDAAAAVWEPDLPRASARSQQVLKLASVSSSNVDRSVRGADVR
jgi:hypothetical protein